MKKILLTPALLLAMGTAKAQLALQNFNSPGIPSGWTMINVDGKTPGSVWVARIITGLTAEAWMKWPTATTGDSLMISTSVFSTPGQADRWLVSPAFDVTSADMLISWKDAELSSATGALDSMQVWVSETGGATPASFTTRLGTSVPTSTALASKMLSLGAFNGKNVRIGFRNVGTNAGIIGMDDVQTITAAAKTDAGLVSMTFPELLPTTGSTQLRVLLTNAGNTVLTSVQLNYSVDGGTPVVQTFSGFSLIPGASGNFTFTTGVSGFTPGAHTLAVNILQANGTADAFATNNTLSQGFIGASKSVSRNGLMEEFTSSTCPPCATFNATFDPLLLSLPANVPSTKFNVIKYQMNWPSPGNDVCYNTEGDRRKTYYGVTGIPDHFTNGMVGGAGNLAEINNSKVDPAYMDITGTYTVKKDSLVADVTITPHFTATGVNHRVHMASLEYNYTNNGATTSQKQYYHVMRNMAGAGNGITVTSWTDGVPQKFRWAYKFTTGTPVQFSNTFWGHPFGGSLVVFVQNQNTKTVYQSQGFPTSWPASVKESSELISDHSVYPNPATDHTTIAFKLEAASNVTVHVVDALGRTVQTVAEQKMEAGTQVVPINTNNLPSGIYTINVKSENNIITERFSVVK